jgi:hypothetical protein
MVPATGESGVCTLLSRGETDGWWKLHPIGQPDNQGPGQSEPCLTNAKPMELSTLQEGDIPWGDFKQR